MLMTLIQKEVMHHILSVRFVALLLMCLLLVPLTLSTNYRNYRQNLMDYQEAIKLANIEETTMNPGMPLEPELEVSKLFLKPTPLSVFANGLADALPGYLGMTRNGITQGAPALTSSLSYLLGHLDFLFVVGIVFSLLALLFTFDAVAKEEEHKMVMKAPPNDGLTGEIISAVAAVGEQIFTGTGRGLYRLDSGIWTKLPVETSGAVYSLTVSKNNLYVGTGPDLLRFTPIKTGQVVPIA